MTSRAESEPYNPWTSEDTLLGLKFGDPQSGVVIARRCGLLGKVRQEPERVTHRSSVQLIHALQNISKLNQSLQEIECELHRHLLDRESHDLMHKDVLEKHLQSINTLLSHFTNVLASKEQILSCLQSSSRENSLQVEAPFQKHLSHILHSISPTLSDLSSSISCIEAAAALDLTNLKVKMASAVESLVMCRDLFQNCHQLHTQYQKAYN